MLASPIPASFARKKAAILAALSLPTDEYQDRSPKGSVDDEIRDLIDEINAYDGLVTTSSCAGRIAVFLEGDKAPRGPGNNNNNNWSSWTDGDATEGERIMPPPP